MGSLRHALLGGVTILALAWSADASACGGVAGRDVAMTYSGQKYMVTNLGRHWLHVAFTAFGTTYAFQLAPGQSAAPHTAGMFPQPMSGYQSCVATPIPATGASFSQGAP